MDQPFLLSDHNTRRHRRKSTHLHVAVLDLPGLLLWRRVVEGVVVAELEEPLDTGGRVLRTLTVVAVRERHDETGPRVRVAYCLVDRMRAGC